VICLSYECPFCSCVFSYEYDLNLHLDCFGRNAVLHGRKFRRVHFDIEFTLSREHGGVDRVVRDFERIIFSYAEKCKKSDQKVRVL